MNKTDIYSEKYPIKSVDLDGFFCNQRVMLRFIWIVFGNVMREKYPVLHNKEATIRGKLRNKHKLCSIKYLFPILLVIFSSTPWGLTARLWQVVNYCLKTSCDLDWSLFLISDELMNVGLGTQHIMYCSKWSENNRWVMYLHHIRQKGLNHLS